MTRLLYAIILTAAMTGGFLYAGAASKEEPAKVPSTPFEYPLAPDTLSTLEARTSYVMLHFWDKADMKKVMADTAKFHKAFADYVGFIPYAAKDSVRKSINALTSRYSNDPKALSLIASEAERTLFGPEADFWSEDSYLLFLRPLLANKKVKSAEKEKYLTHIRMLNSSIPGSNISNFDYTTRHGARHSLYDNKAEYTILLFQPEECADCSMARLRLNADAATTRLIKNGTVKIVLVNPAEPTAKWRDEMSEYPYEWEIGSAPEADKLVDLRLLPTTYLLDKDFRILAKRIDLNQLLALMANINQYQMLMPDNAGTPGTESTGGNETPGQ
ncbi:DUF5106 domain-containing protein [uncultured Muribaculum sp.]|uniref:DUF5106 domain-containing protein n=1 Tax=uncultured Muribaculum sp. TaxID=1918613 RepID=UPI0025EC4987|nr:DUF5106 domain-containing protein [uncultured Muribaculum sp.]